MTGERKRERAADEVRGRRGEINAAVVLFFGKERQTNWQTDHRQTTALTTHKYTHTLTYTTTRTHIAGKEIPDINAN